LKITKTDRINANPISACVKATLAFTKFSLLPSEKTNINPDLTIKKRQIKIERKNDKLKKAGTKVDPASDQLRAFINVDRPVVHPDVSTPPSQVLGEGTAKSSARAAAGKSQK
jgi:hypothetical protein